jgi:hypothetical protein
MDLMMLLQKKKMIEMNPEFKKNATDILDLYGKIIKMIESVQKTTA